MSSLDRPELLRSLDPGDMYGAIASFPEQLRLAAAIGQALSVDLAAYRSLDSIVVCGMGGSAIGGDLARSLLQDTLHLPMAICRGYALPAFAGPDSLVIGSSYSGNTEETLSAFAQAIKRRCRSFVMTTGGRLGEIAAAEKIPRVLLPSGLQPRAALGYSFVPLLLFLHKIGQADYSPETFSALAGFLESRIPQLAREAPSEQNPAKQLALRLYGRMPIIYSGPELTDAAATRIKGQICENAKMLAFANQFPEFNHNELVGWKIVQAFREYLRVLILRDRDDHPRVAARMDIVKGMIEKQQVEVVEIYSDGQSRLERLFSLIQLGDFISYYLAILNKVDPTPVEPIEFLKGELANIPPRPD